MNSRPRSSQIRRTAAKYSAVAGLTPPSPCTGSSNTADTDGSSDASNASASHHATCRKPSGSGQKTSCFAGWPVACSVARVRPWNDPYTLTTTCRPRPPHLRASLMAHSFASAPELQKNTCPVVGSVASPETNASIVVATSGPTVVPNRLDVWSSVVACAYSASATAGWLWPSEVTASPDRKSR